MSGPEPPPIAAGGPDQGYGEGQVPGRAQGPAPGAAWTVMPSPIDELLLTTDGRALTGVFFSLPAGRRGSGSGADGWPPRAGPRLDDHELLRRAVGQLDEYFAGQRTDFDLPLAPAGTAFQQRVWAALLDVPYGRTASYGEIAAVLGLPPGASRAVGLANGANPIPIIIPCHRIIGANGSLVGYGGGLDRKRLLLALEGGSLF